MTLDELRKELTIADGGGCSGRLFKNLYYHDLVEFTASAGRTGHRWPQFTAKGKDFAQLLKACIHEAPTEGPRHVYLAGTPKEWSVPTQLCPSCGKTRRAIGPDPLRGWYQWSTTP